LGIFYKPMANLLDLPNAILRTVFLKFSFKTFNNVYRLNKRIYKICSDENFQKESWVLWTSEIWNIIFNNSTFESSQGSRKALVYRWFKRSNSARREKWMPFFFSNYVCERLWDSAKMLEEFGADIHKEIGKDLCYGHYELIQLYLNYPYTDPSFENNSFIINACSAGTPNMKIIKALAYHPKFKFVNLDFVINILETHHEFELARFLLEGCQKCK
jgi:hypothetical protein